MESWQKSWRALARNISTAGLEALRRALVEDDPRLIQGSTTTPPPISCVRDWPVEQACGIAYCGWQGDELETVGEVEEFFARICFEADQIMDEPMGCRWFLNFFDETPREEMIRLLLTEVEKILEERRYALIGEKYDAMSTRGLVEIEDQCDPFIVV